LRTSVAIALASYVALASGEVALIDAPVCVQNCADDDAQGDCAADCSDCSCCAHQRTPFAAVLPRVFATAAAARIPPGVQLPPAAPEPGDILHVPKTSLT
jgi:hypothetical protein